MRKVSEYLEHAAECRKMASQMRNPQHKKQLEDMAQAWEMLARERARQLAKTAKVDAAPESEGRTTAKRLRR
jgi:hypothetical protein